MGEEILVGGGGAGAAVGVGAVNPAKSSSKRSLETETADFEVEVGAGACACADTKLKSRPPLDGARTGGDWRGAIGAVVCLGGAGSKKLPPPSGDVNCAGAGVALADVGLLKAPKSPKADDGFGGGGEDVVPVFEKFNPPKASDKPPKASF